MNLFFWRKKAYDAISKIKWKDSFYRNDIGYRAIEREKISFIDLLINEVDKGLKYSTQNYQTDRRRYPKEKVEQGSLNELEKSFCRSYES